MSFSWWITSAHSASQTHQNKVRFGFCSSVSRSHRAWMLLMCKGRENNMQLWKQRASMGDSFTLTWTAKLHRECSHSNCSLWVGNSTCGMEDGRRNKDGKTLRQATNEECSWSLESVTSTLPIPVPILCVMENAESKLQAAVWNKSCQVLLQGVGTF